MEYESPLGRKKVGSSGGERKSYVVEDESLEIPSEPVSLQPGVPVQLTAEQYNLMQSKRKEILAAQKKPSSGSKQRLEILADLGRLTQDVKIGEHVFTIESLKSKETREIYSAAANLEVASEAVFEIRTQTLARAIAKIDGHSVGMVIGDSLEERLLFLDEMEEHVINKLYSTFTEMMKSIEIKSKEEAKEVAEEIKK